MTENVEGKKHDSSNVHRAGLLEVYHWENKNQAVKKVGLAYSSAGKCLVLHPT